MDSIRVTMAPNEELLIGNVVATNVGAQTAELSIMGTGPILRREQILDAKDAITPALKIYYLVTSLYIHPSLFAQLNPVLSELSRDMVLAVPSSGEFIADIGEAVAVGDYRLAHQSAQELLHFEQALEDLAAK